MFLKLISVGLGWVAPIGGISTNVTPTGGEIKVCFQFQVFPKLEYSQLKLITLTRERLNINIYQITEGAKIRIYKKLYLLIGGGGYYLTEKWEEGEEVSYGTCSYYGVSMDFKLGQSKIVTPEITYYTVPRSIAILLNIGIKL